MSSNRKAEISVNKEEKSKIRVSAPGRIVFAGEHQDYFSLPVISAAISVRISIEGHLLKNKPFARLHLQNMRRTLNIPLNFPIQYRFRRSYLKSGLNVFNRAGFKIPGFEAEISSKIPQNAGLSSSSALCVAWARFLLEICDSGNDPSSKTVADWAHKIEVEEFNEPGGQQDQLASALGGINYMQFPYERSAEYQELEALYPINVVVGHSLIRKNTIRTLLRIRRLVAEALKQMYGKPELKYLSRIQVDQIEQTEREFTTLKGILKIRDLTQQMRLIIRDDKPLEWWGRLLNEQHTVLRDYLHLSLPKIENMVENSLKAGAYGAKINGSGNGGCMFALCHEDNVKKIAKGIEEAGGKPYIVHIDKGVRLEE